MLILLGRDLKKMNAKDTTPIKNNNRVLAKILNIRSKEDATTGLSDVTPEELIGTELVVRTGLDVTVPVPPFELWL